MTRLLLFLALPLFILDQFTKWLVLQNISVDDVVTVIPDFFFLVQAHNTGAAFSLLENNNRFFIGLSVVALIVVTVLIRRGMFADRWMSLGVTLLLSGVCGNLVDRVLHGHVIDFLLVNLHVWPANPWPVFNVADSCICTAAGIFVLRSFFEPKNESPEQVAPRVS